MATQTKYVIQCTRTMRAVRTIPHPGWYEWCDLGEGETKFDSMTEATLFAIQYRIEHYKVVPV